MTVTVLPGMGADHQMYAGPWLDLPDFEFLDWPTGPAPTSIQDLARRIASGLSHRPTAIIGSSLGGMVALECSDLIGVKDVILLGSATSHHEINGLLKFLGPLAEMTPLGLCQALAGKSGLPVSQMYARQDPDFIRSMVRAALTWSYAGSARIFRIHGSRDHVIRCRAPDVSLDGGHLIAMTHAAACITAIQRHLIDIGEDGMNNPKRSPGQ